VLSIGKLGADQAGYYERQVANGRDDYYSGRGEAPGEWTGRGAQALGLEGVVAGAQFKALMAGINPADPELAGPLRSSENRKQSVVGFDLTFSAPKSVSVLFAVADEETAGQLIGAHEAAVRAALDYLEDEAVKVRRGRGGVRVEAAEGVVAAAYRHRMSRALDPQLHTHVVCANVARGPDGQWTALHGRELYTHAKTAGFLYQAHLRGEVRDRLGLEWGPVVKGAAELVDVAPEVLAHFSTRSREAREAAEEAEQELDSWERRNHWALKTRERKQYGVETHAWRQEVRARASEHGLDAAAIDALLEHGRAHAMIGDDGAGAERAVGDVLAGPEGLTEKANTFAARDVLREYAAAAAQGARVGDVRARGARFAERGDVLDTVAGGLTSQDLVAAERRLIAAAVGRAGEHVAVVDDAGLRRALAGAERPLTDEQAEAVRAVATSGNGVDVIEALAGAGKTFIAGTLRHVYEDAGYRVIGVAPTGRAVRELAEEAGVAAWTLDRALLDLEQGDELPERTVVLLDEAGMAATRTTERLLGAAQRAGAKVVAIGDCGQLASVQAGGWMRAVGERVGVHRLTQVMRQRDVDERRALAQLHDGRPGPYLRWAQDRERVVVHTSEDDAVVRDAALEDWKLAVDDVGVIDALLIARDNATRGALNQAAREHRRAQGALGDDVEYGPVTVAVGDRIICRRNDRYADVDNGTRGTLRATHRDLVVIDTDAGAVRELPAGYVAEHVEHAYCLTGHGMQGATVEHATVLALPRELSQGWSYTALSRARGATRLHIDGRDVHAAERAELAPHERQEHPDRAQVLARVAARMRVRDDEDLAVTQLPARPAPGRADDPQLRDTPAGLATALPEHSTERAEPRLTQAPEHARLAAIGAEADRLTALLAGLPMRELRQLDRVAAERVGVAAQRDDTAARLQALPAPERTLLGRMRDPQAAERARLAAAVGAADQQLVALDRYAARLQRDVGPVQAVRDERDGLDRRLAQLDAQGRDLRDALAERDVAQPPAWAQQLFGERPAHPRQAEQYDRGVREVARFRIEHEVSDDAPELGPEPSDARQRGAWRQAANVARQVQRRLGREVTRARDLGIDR
jgi:conjugative relaxase-like TrwC/TraI family protein